MACKITSLSTPCGYNPGGLSSAQIMDSADFVALQFRDDQLENTAFVESVYGRNPIALPIGATSRWNTSKVGPVHSHTLETYIHGLDATLIASLELARRREYVVVFTARTGTRFLFGYEGGAVLTYTASSVDGLGASVSLTSRSKHPIFELAPDAVLGIPRVAFEADFDLGAFCTF